VGAGQTDEQLVSSVSGSDNRAFGELFDRHSRAVYLYAWGAVQDARDAEDITQDVFETAWRKARLIRIVDSSALPWLLVTARNSVSNHRRRARLRRTSVLDEAIVTAMVDSDAAEELQWVRLEIGKLSAIDQRVCELCLVEGHSYKEAAQQLGLTTSALAKRVERLRVHLRATARSES
jgi:RNA polymerase sigma factor (sigma-70 family)